MIGTMSLILSVTLYLCHDVCVKNIQLQFLVKMYVSGNCKSRCFYVRPDNVVYVTRRFGTCYISIFFLFPVFERVLFFLPMVEVSLFFFLDLFLFRFSSCPFLVYQKLGVRWYNPFNYYFLKKCWSEDS